MTANRQDRADSDSETTPEAKRRKVMFPFAMTVTEEDLRSLLPKPNSDIVVRTVDPKDSGTPVPTTLDNRSESKREVSAPAEAVEAVPVTPEGPERTIFGASTGKFLDFIMTNQGMRANPDKVKAIMELREPQTLEDVRKLIRRLTVLHRFLSRGANRALPFFKVLLRAENKDRFSWGEEQAEAFADLRRYLSSPPPLSRPRAGETLYLYLAYSKETISSVLMKEDEGEQKPVYFFSKILKGAELRYPPNKKALFTVIMTARRLKPFFQRHQIVVYSEHPLKRTLDEPKAAGRMLPWLLEMVEFRINYRPRPTIKAQILADFIVENTAKVQPGAVYDDTLSPPSAEPGPEEEGNSPQRAIEADRISAPRKEELVDPAK